jgi:hypothetical protein
VATLSDIEPLPVIIKEVLYPAAIPFQTRTFIGNFSLLIMSEAAIHQHLQNNFSLSLENFQQARK